MKNFFGLGLFLLGAAAVLIFGLPAIFNAGVIAAPVILIGFIAVFFSAYFVDTTEQKSGAQTSAQKTGIQKQISMATALRIGLFVLSVIVALVGLINIFTAGRTAASFYLFIVGLLAAFAAAAVAGKQWA